MFTTTAFKCQHVENQKLQQHYIYTPCVSKCAWYLLKDALVCPPIYGCKDTNMTVATCG